GDNRGKCSINIASMNTVKMYPMRHIALIDKMYTNTISCGSSYCWSWHPTIKRPARKWLAGGGIKGFIGRDNRVLTQRLSIGKFADLARIKASQDLRRIEAVELEINISSHK